MGRLALNFALVALTIWGLAGSSRAQLLFGPPVSTPIGGPAAMGVAAGDVNGDLFADLVIGHAGTPGLRLGDGTGHFGPEAPIAVGASGSTVLLANVDQDGIPDLLAGSSSTGLLYVAHCDGRGGFEAADSYSLGPTTPSNRLSLDVQWPNFLAVTAGAIGGSAGEARVFRVVGDGDLELTGVFSPGPSPNRIVGGQVGSLNGDAWPDVVLQLDSGTTSPVLTVTAYVGQPGGTFIPTWSLGDATLGRLGGFELGGSEVDLLTLGSSGGVAAITAHMGVGDGTFIAGAVSEIATTVGVSICGLSDLDQDYIIDVVAVRQVPAELWVMHGDGLGNFATNAKVTLSPGAPTLAAGAGVLGDFDEGGGPANFDVIVPVGLGTTTPSVSVCFNRTYLGGFPLLDLGHQLQGTNWPIQIVEGSFLPGTPFAFKLSAAVPSGPAFHVAGLSVLDAPFKGGTMVPNPFLITGPLLTSPGGALTLAGTAWPGGTSGLLLASQFWFPDPAGPAGFASSSGMRIAVP